MANGSDGRTTITTADDVRLEADLARAEDAWAVAVVTHPHPLMGGDMDNPVPAGVTRGLAAAGVSALRFNFRGAGASGGTHGEGDPERLDVTAAIDAAAEAEPGVPVVGVGYSFGADVLLATADGRLAGVVAVAPPLRVFAEDVLEAPRRGHPTLVLIAEHDQFCDPSRARAISADWPATTVEVVPGVDHFLAGGVAVVVERAVRFVREELDR